MPQYNGERKDILIRQILKAIGEDNRRDIIERIWKERQERVKKGCFPGGNTPYGYKRKGKHFATNLGKAEVILHIYSRRSRGKFLMRLLMS